MMPGSGPAGHYLNKLHHAAIFVCKDVAVEDE